MPTTLTLSCWNPQPKGGGGLLHNRYDSTSADRSQIARSHATLSGKLRIDPIFTRTTRKYPVAFPLEVRVVQMKWWPVKISGFPFSFDVVFSIFERDFLQRSTGFWRSERHGRAIRHVSYLKLCNLYPP
jgi:hypothetical protein